MNRISLNCLTIRKAKLEEQIKATSSAGYAGIGLRYDDIHDFLNEGHNLEDVASLIRKYNLSVVEMSFGPGWQYTNKEIKKQTLNKAEQTFRYCKALDCSCVVACASAESGDIERATKDYQELCKMGEEHGVKLALEFLGFAKQIKNLKTAWEIVQKADASNGGILLDVFHFYRGGSSISDLKSIPIEKILLIHLSDAPKISLNKLKDADRVFPGEGVIPFNDILQVINKKGYQGYFSLELLNPTYWEDDPYKIAQKGIDSVKKLLK